ncbi:MAG: hypothetical protein ACERLG_06490 [Sedimentibacter sp.]
MRDDIVILDSITMANPEHKDKVIVAGSHGGFSASKKYALPIEPKLIFLNDAGKGKADAGIDGIKFLGENQIPAAAVSSMSAMIGDGQDMYENGIVSFVNGPAEEMGLKEGIAVKDAVKLAFVNQISDDIVLINSIAMGMPEHEGKVIVCGSHGGIVAGKYVAKVRPKMVFLNDAGLGKNDAGISGVKELDEQNLAAATVDAMTAIIGNAKDSYLHGVVSFVNKGATALGVKVGMTVKDAVELVR